MALELTCEALGVTPDEIADRVAQKVADRMLAEVVPGYDDETGAAIDTERPTRFQEMVRKRVARKVEQAVDAAAERVLGAGLAERLEAMRFPQTNHYGEPKSEPLTLLEFIARRVDTYMSERVDLDGRSGPNAYGTKDQTRVTWMVDKHLQYTIENEMNRALKSANESIVGGIEETVKIKLAEIAAKLKVELKVPR